MRPFAEIVDEALAHHDRQEIEAGLAVVATRPAAEIAATTDDCILSLMTRRVFYAGFSQKQIDAKWRAFEDAFHHFAPAACAAIDEPELDALLANTAIVRNGAKIASVRNNARFVLTLSTEHGGAGRFFADWPDARYDELLYLLERRGSRLGGDTGPRFLRALGKPGFVLTKDVVAALVGEGVITSPPTSRKQMAAVQTAMNAWSKESGLNLSEISRYLAWSIGSTPSIVRR